jgi:hypothetical protein
MYNSGAERLYEEARTLLRNVLAILGGFLKQLSFRCMEFMQLEKFESSQFVIG